MESKQKTSIFSKIFAIVYLALLVFLMVVACIYLAVGSDFIAPISFQVDNDCYDYTIDEFAEFLTENGYIQGGDYESVSLDGVTEARLYGDTYVLYWDTASMEKEGEEYLSWKQTSNVGNMTLENGSLIIVYGCFGVSYKEKAEDAEEETYEFLENFPSAYSGNHGNDTVWDYTFEEFIDYMCELGYFKADDRDLMSTIGTENWIYNGVDVIWWDVNNLVEGTEAYEYWTEFQENGYIIYGTKVYSPVFNGPFAVSANAGFPYDTAKFYEDFAAFPANYSKRHTSEAKSVWDYTMDDLIDYLDGLGLIDKDNVSQMSDVGTVNKLCDGVDLIWWDVENLVEGTQPYEYWNQMQNDGYIWLYEVSVYVPVMNGPFGIHASAYDGDTVALYEAFNNFPKNYSPSGD